MRLLYTLTILRVGFLRNGAILMARVFGWLILIFIAIAFYMIITR